MNPEEIFGKGYMEFCEVDPFNDNEVSGYISRTSDDTYGALLIDKVNGVTAPQLILCTPKMHYPFDKQGTWKLPAAKRIERYEKLDGTNIFAFRYTDSDNREYASFKTRLRPFVGNSRFGPFMDMLTEFIDRNPSLKTLTLDMEMNISFELWGARNPHLVKYNVPLELSILFYRKDGKVRPPLIPLEYPNAPHIGSVENNFKDTYQLAQMKMDSLLEDTGDGYYIGQEGEVWYVLTEDGLWRQFKCKPGTIEAIHWAAGGISKNQILATCENAFENWEHPTPENIATLLLEEFTQQEIDKVHYRIPKYLDEVFQKHLFIERVMREYQDIGLNILADKNGTMRALSGKFARNEMQRVYATVMAHVVS